MNFCGIICEFNPFHNGHEYLIQQTKKILNCDIVCLMSGDFVQRGIPAIESKYERAKKAIDAGADMVAELPCIYACSNAENFAFGAIKTLSALNITHLAFGIENSNLEILKQIADLKVQNSQEFQNAFKNEIENGINYNTALKRTIAKCFNDDENILDILAKPNNILAIEYLSAIKKLGAKIIPIAINRIDNGFESRISQDKFLSATAIRERLANGENVDNFIPKFAKIKEPFSKNHYEIFEKLAIFKLRMTTAKELEKYYDFQEGIEYRIKEISEKYNYLDEITNQTATPRYRKPRINKLLIYPLLEITKQIQQKSKQTKAVCKLLAIKKDKKYLLSIIRKTKINLIITNNDYKLLNNNQRKLIDIDLNASNIYNLITNKIHNCDKKTGVIFK